MYSDSPSRTGQQPQYPTTFRSLHSLWKNFWWSKKEKRKKNSVSLFFVLCWVSLLFQHTMSSKSARRGRRRRSHSGIIKHPKIRPQRSLSFDSPPPSTKHKKRLRKVATAGIASNRIAWGRKEKKKKVGKGNSKALTYPFKNVVVLCCVSRFKNV